MPNGDKLTLIIWTDLTVSLDGQQTANTLFVKMLDHVYKVSPASISAGLNARASNYQSKKAALLPFDRQPICGR